MANDNQQWDSLWINVNIATMADMPTMAAGADGTNSYGSILNGAIGVKDQRIIWVGKQSELPQSPQKCAREIHDGQHQWLTPGLIDCHTHLVFGGNRATEFAQRLGGVSYTEISKAGGGIRSTVTATRAATEKQLMDSAQKRLNHLMAEGVTSLEIKSGYGLDTKNEVRMLQVARALEQHNAIGVSTTFLGAHSIPNAYEARPQDYIDLVCEQMIPEIARLGLADAVDAFCETIAFSPAQTAQVFDQAKAHNLPVKLHADQLSDSGGAKLAADYGALSADHIEYSSEQGIAAMAEAGVTAVLLPGAFYTLRETQQPPLELLRRYKVPIAIATDANPGSSPTTSLLLMVNMACTLFRMLPSESFAGVTINAAKALGLDHDRGSLEVGKRADFALWDIHEMSELGYWVGVNPCTGRVKNGVYIPH